MKTRVQFQYVAAPTDIRVTGTARYEPCTTMRRIKAREVCASPFHLGWSSMVNGPTVVSHVTSKGLPVSTAERMRCWW